MIGSALWPLLVFVGLVFGVVLLMLGGSYLLGGRHRGQHAEIPWESGMPLTGTARVRFSAHYYLMAMFFVIFDLEAAFVLAWAVAARDVGWRGYLEMVVFVIVLLLGLVYLWRTGALDWNTAPRDRMED